MYPPKAILMVSLLAVSLLGNGLVAAQDTTRSTRGSLSIRPLDNAAPIIIISEPGQTRGVSIRRRVPSLRIVGKVMDGSPIVSFQIGGVEVALDESGGFDHEVALEIGSNEIRLVAVDDKDNLGTTAVRVDREKDLEIAGRYLALVIGIDSYTGEWPRLNNAARDARTVSALLQEKFGFENVIELYDEDATRENIITSVEGLDDILQPDDNLLIYYSGHGQLDERFGRGYWVPADAETSSTSGLIANTTVQTWIGGLNTRHTLLIADACFSGDVFRSGPTGERLEGTSDYYQRVHDLISRQALTSGGVEPVLDGGKDGHSVFAYYMLKALRETESEYYDASQLFEAIRFPVINNSDQQPLFNVIHDTGDEGGQFVFVNRS
jgi:Caspase domain